MNDSGDLRPTYHAHLAALNDDLADVCAGVAQSMATATAALLAAHREDAEQVIGLEDEVDRRTTLIGELCFELVALQQPVASDLGTVLSVLRMSASVERMGDLVEHIATVTVLRHPARAVPEFLAPRFAEMGRIGASMAVQAAEAIRTRDADVGRQILLADDEVDRLYASILSDIDADGAAMGSASLVDLTLLARFFERFADHAVSIARRVLSLSTGEPYASIGRP